MFFFLGLINVHTPFKGKIINLAVPRESGTSPLQDIRQITDLHLRGLVKNN